jgi:hypothetical protein
MLQERKLFMQTEFPTKARSSRRLTFLKNTNSQELSPFFNLSWELRSEIYELAFGRRIVASTLPNTGALSPPEFPWQYMFHDECADLGTKDCAYCQRFPHDWKAMYSGPNGQKSKHFSYQHLCRCEIRGCVRLLRTCQRMYFEARALFFASMAFDFNAVPFQAFVKVYLCPQPHDFDPANCMRSLTLRRPLPYPPPFTCDEHLEEVAAWSAALNILRSPRWNLSHLILENAGLNLLSRDELTGAQPWHDQSFSLICQLRAIRRVDIRWWVCDFAAHNFFRSNNSGLDKYREIHDKALNEITSQPRPVRRRGRRTEFTKKEIQETTSQLVKRVKEMVIQEGLGDFLDPTTENSS